jgi:hypothetical protein
MSFDPKELTRPMPLPVAYESQVRIGWYPDGDTDCERIYSSGRAWSLDVNCLFPRLDRSRHAMIAWWLIEAPWAHPIWHSYALTLMHLRQVCPDMKRIFHLDGATHELCLHALKPEGNREMLFSIGFGEGSCIPMYPPNFAAQIIEESDQEAVQRIEDTVHDICDGKLSPDTDFRRDWVARFGDNMVRK